MKFYFMCLGNNCYKDFGWNLHSLSHSWIYLGNVTWMQAAVLILAPSNLVVPVVPAGFNVASVNGCLSDSAAFL